MSNAADNIIDIITQTFYSITDVYNAIDAAIAAAVQAEHQRGDQRVLDEREACAKVAIETSGDQATRARIATAIRARGNGGK